MGAVQKTIQSTLWAQKTENGWILRVHPVHLPRGTWQVVWNVVTFTSSPSMEYEPFTIASIHVLNAPPPALGKAKSVSISQYVMTLNNSKTIWGNEKDAMAEYEIEGSDGEVILKIYDPTIIVGTDPDYVPPGW
jgi:hypothetical protein